MENKINLKLIRNSILSMLLLGSSAYTIASLITRYSGKKAVTGTPAEILNTVYVESNRFFNDGSLSHITRLEPYYSKSLLAVLKQYPGLVIYTMARETHKGKLKQLLISKQLIKGDSAFVSAVARFGDGSQKAFLQHFIRENGEWKFALLYRNNMN